MNKLNAILALALLTSCGKPVTVDAEFPKYLSRFEADAEVRGVHVSTKGVSVLLRERDEMPLDALGECTLSDTDPPTIEIAKEFWNNSTEYGRKQLLYHELGHCILNRDHIRARLQPGVPFSIMNPKHFSDKTFIKYEKYYLDELFSTRDTWL